MEHIKYRNELFDIACCPHSMDKSCECDAEDKVTGETMVFLADQRGQREMKGFPVKQSLSLRSVTFLKNEEKERESQKLSLRKKRKGRD